MKALLDAGADVNSPNADNQTALMVVARSANIDTARLMIEHGADIHATEKIQGQNAIIYAAAQSQPDMVKLLLEAGANPSSRSIPNERDRQISQERRFQWRAAGGFTALGYAAREGCLACARHLVEAGADIDQGDAENVTPLNLAVMNLRFDTAKYLVEA
jgi:ankyrin repeat protein